MQQRIGRILLRPLALQFLITSEVLSYADEESPLDAGRFDVDPGVHGLEMIRLEKITPENSDFPAFLWLPDNAQIEPEVGGDGKGEHAPEGGVGWFCTGSAPIGVSAIVSHTPPPPPAPLRGDEVSFYM